MAFKNNDPFTSCISKTNNTFIGNAGNLDIVMPTYNLLEYSDNCSMRSGSLWNYYRDEIDDVGDTASAIKSFKCKTKIIGKPQAQPPRSGIQKTHINHHNHA